MSENSALAPENLDAPSKPRGGRPRKDDAVDRETQLRRARDRERKRRKNSVVRGKTTAELAEEAGAQFAKKTAPLRRQAAQVLRAEILAPSVPENISGKPISELTDEELSALEESVQLQVRAIALLNAPAAISQLVSMMTADDVSPREQKACALAIVERALGSAEQKTTTTIKVDANDARRALTERFTRISDRVAPEG